MPINALGFYFCMKVLMYAGIYSSKNPTMYRKIIVSTVLLLSFLWKIPRHTGNDALQSLKKENMEKDLIDKQCQEDHNNEHLAEK